MKNKLREAAHHWMVPVWCGVTLWDGFYWATPEWLNAIMVVIVLPMMLFCILFGWSHGRKLCLTCIKNAPDNPEQEIRKRARWLRVFHMQMENFWWSIGIIVCLLGFAYFIQFVISDATWVDHLANVPLDIYVTGLMAVGAIHHRLNVWCPWCKGWNDDGPGIITPDPIPQGEKQR